MASALQDFINANTPQALASVGANPNQAFFVNGVAAHPTTQGLAADPGTGQQVTQTDISSIMAALRQAGNFSQAQVDELKREFDQDFGLKQAAITGSYQGEPTEATNEFNKTLGITEAGLTGTFNGQPTLAAQAQNAALTGVAPNSAAQIAKQIQMAISPGDAQFGNLLTGYIQDTGSVPSSFEQLGQYAQSKGINASGWFRANNPNPALYDKYNGMLASLASQFPNGGIPTEAAREFNTNTGMDVLKLLSSLSGPANAFQQQAVLNGLDASGLSNAVGAIQGQFGLPTFQAPQANPQAASLDSLMNMVGGRSANTFAGANNGATNSVGAPSTVSGSTASYLNALPAPNKINAPNFLRLDPDTQKFLLSAYGAAGYSPTSVTNSIQQTLPKFKAPDAGSIAA